MGEKNNENVVLSEGVIRVETEVNVSVTKALTRKARTLYSAFAIIFFVAAIVEAAFVLTGNSSPLCHFAVAAGIFVAICCLIMLSAENRKIASCSRQHDLNRYEFAEYYMTVGVFRDGENVRCDTVYYSDVKKTRTAGGYILLFINSVNAYPVEIAKLSPDQRKAITGRIKKARCE